MELKTGRFSEMTQDEMLEQEGGCISNLFGSLFSGLGGLGSMLGGGSVSGGANTDASGAMSGGLSGMIPSIGGSSNNAAASGGRGGFLSNIFGSIFR